MTWFARTCLPALILSAALGAQETAAPSSETTAVVNEIMSRPGLVMIGFEAQMAQSSGDGVAIAIARTQPRTALRDPDKARRVIALIGAAFVSPTVIAAEENKNPGVSLLLLDAILRDASDAKVQRDAQALIAKLEALAKARSVAH
jgi:hypothetical protein